MLKLTRKKKTLLITKMYCNDHFQSIKLGADSFLTEAVVADPGSFNLFSQIGAAFVIIHWDIIITDRG